MRDLSVKKSFTFRKQKSTNKEPGEKNKSLGQSLRGKYPYFWRYSNFLVTQCRLGRRKPLCQNLWLQHYVYFVLLGVYILKLTGSYSVGLTY